MENVVRCKVMLDVETVFDDEESDASTLLYCLLEDIKDINSGNSGFVIHHAEVVE